VACDDDDDADADADDDADDDADAGAGVVVGMSDPNDNAEKYSTVARGMFDVRVILPE